MRQLNVGFVVRQLVWSAACVLAAGGVSAAEAAADDELEQVVVTGSRLATSGFSSPTPVTVLGADAIEELGITNIGAGANQLPAFRATTTPTTNGFGSFNVGAQIVNLRGLGVTRNLVLVDGRRFAPVTREGTVDLNLVPSGLVERLEVVTGGASAAYGSDAVAGAVNVILDKDLTGIKAQADYGVTGEGDGQNYHLSLAGGASFAGGRGHFILGGEYAKQDGIGDCFTRSYCTNSGVITNTGAASNSALGVTLYRVNSGAGFIANPRGVINSLNTTNVAIRNLLGDQRPHVRRCRESRCLSPGNPLFGRDRRGPGHHVLLHHRPARGAGGSLRHVRARVFRLHRQRAGFHRGIVRPCGWRGGPVALFRRGAADLRRQPVRSGCDPCAVARRVRDAQRRSSGGRQLQPGGAGPAPRAFGV
ncbi:MAG: TonB-dependent receptor plug domain-containing protein [Proteobacteria bacterium]|nr:TonB-dependent receptor plug domain-containing protein [Pseudomonadota bacterium]